MASSNSQPTPDQNDESSPSRRPGCLVYLVIIGVGSLATGAWLMSRWDTLPGLARVGVVMLIVIGTLALLPPLLLLALRIVLKGLVGKVEKELSGAAQQMVDANESMYGEVHEFRPAEDEDFEDLNRGFYENTAQELARIGFRHLGDIVDETVEEISGISPPIRVLASADGSTQVGLYHFKIPGRHAQLSGDGMLICDVSTEFSDGTFLLTSNTQESDLTTPPPRIHRRQHPLATSPLALVQAHEREKQNLLAAKAGLTCVIINTLDDALASERRQQQAKNDFRKEIGYVDPEEVRRVTDSMGADPEVSDMAAEAVDEARKREQQG